MNITNTMLCPRFGDAEAEYVCGGAGHVAVLPGVAELPTEACRSRLH